MQTGHATSRLPGASGGLRGDVFAAIHETMEILYEFGAVGKQTMREFDDACLTPVPVLAPDEIKAIRLREHISQPVFARYLIETSSGPSTIGCTLRLSVPNGTVAPVEL